MPEEKRTFETEVFSSNSLQLQPAAGDEDKNKGYGGSPRSKEENPYSKEMILRLIRWLERS
ncbi:MAG TPA: hypothetical protein VE136_18410 [Anaerolineales bacterium]|jgi:hypothetical protein|nr:hypothetical protein [Anaerolineales bacterium]